ncbi:MAG: HD domain-containing protein [Mycobacteriales bacterium]
MNVHGPDLLAAWTAVVGDGPIATEVWTELIGRWSEPHRTYHGLAHLTAVLAVVKAYAEAASDADAVRLAAWFHDAVYDPTRADNEQASAELAGDRLDALGLPPTQVEEVQRLVRVTATHQYADDDSNAALLCDADLAVLVGPPAAYVGYANAIRAEYAHVADGAFRAGRAAVLRGLLDRERLFGTPALRQWEEPARRNVKAELVVLGGDE